MSNSTTIFVTHFLITAIKPSKECVKGIYDEIKVPTRATVGSAGYDFYAPIDMSLVPGVEMKVPTGIRVEIDPGWWLACMPKSGLGFSSIGSKLNNTVGVIDSDYFHSDNEGHIFAKVINDSRQDKNVFITKGDSFITGHPSPLRYFL